MSRERPRMATNGDPMKTLKGKNKLGNLIRVLQKRDAIKMLIN